MMYRDFIEYCYEQHDKVCNQKYADDLPYSFHLKMVRAQAYKFIDLIQAGSGPISGPSNRDMVLMACAGHDLIEDARVSYNDIRQMACEEVAEIIFLCTEMRGRNRHERKNDQFYEELVTNELAVFVKLCDIMANSLYSVLSNSSMLKKQKEEWPRIKEKLSGYYIKYRPMFQCLDKIYALG